MENDNSSKKIVLLGLVLVAISVVYILSIRVAVDKFFVEVDQSLLNQELIEYAKNNTIEDNDTVELNPELFQWPLTASIIYYILLLSFWLGTGFLINRTIKGNKSLVFLVPLFPSIIFLDFLYPIYVAFCYLGGFWGMKHTTNIVN